MAAFLVRSVLAVVALGAMAGCALGPDKPEPKVLEPFAPKLAGRVVWNERIGKVGFPLVPAVQGGAFAVADDDGAVSAFDAASGALRWRASVNARIDAGVGSDGRHYAVVTRAGDLVAIEAGQVRWRQPVGTRVVTPPLVAGERVFVLGVDRSVHAFDAQDGRRLWRQQRVGDPLTLSQVGVLAAHRNTLVVGHGPLMVGLDPAQGSIRWEVALASPRGTNEVERLADLVGPAMRNGPVFCARAFQAAVACVDAEQGTLRWSRNTGGSEGVGGDEQFIVGADASDRLTAWRAASGEVAWSNESYLHHGLAAPRSIGTAFVFGDAKGFVQWISREQGEPLLRLPTDGTAVIGAPVVSGTTLLAVTRGGGVYAFRNE